MPLMKRGGTIINNISAAAKQVFRQSPPTAPENERLGLPAHCARN